MADEEQQLTIVEQFENSSIRKIWYQGEWWYSLVDVMSVFAGTKRSRQYWHDLKKKIVEEEANKSGLPERNNKTNSPHYLIRLRSKRETGGYSI